MERVDCRHLLTHHIEGFLSGLPEHLSLKTKQNIMTGLKTFCNWLIELEILAKRPKFPVLSPPEPAIEWIDKDAQLKILSCLDIHHRPIFEFMMYHPVRPGEARALKVKDFDLALGEVLIQRAFSLKEVRSRKNKKPYRLPLSASFDSAVLKGKFPDMFVFLNKAARPYTSEGLRKLWHKARVKAGIPSIKLYNATRHSIASQAVHNGVDLSLVSRALGHSSLEMTKRYASVSVRMLRAVVDGARLVQNGKKADSN